jgi:carbamoyl-phosphate synthase small subunit
MTKEKKITSACLLLEDGSFFQGKALGKLGSVGGEICFNTGMTGYQEIYSDPSYYGQVIINTHPHIGNYGTHHDEDESDGAKFSGLICNEFSEMHSREDSNGALQDYFERQNIVGISHVDTRGLVRHIRNQGAMNCLISSECKDEAELKERLSAVPSMKGLELSSKVSTAKEYDLGEDSSEFRIAVLDLGVKKSILNNLVARGCFCRVFPHDSGFEIIRKWNPDGIFISNGPGDPASTTYAVELVKKVLESGIPLFGICLGHQILSLASGLKTFKMHHGHRGLNHPVKNLRTGLSEITSQNHGFNVEKFSVKEFMDIEVSHVNLNDESIEGIRRKDVPAFSVQFHPEASPGPHDSRYLFDEFKDLIRSHKKLS